jgi:hypothetical protein
MSHTHGKPGSIPAGLDVHHGPTRSDPKQWGIMRSRTVGMNQVLAMLMLLALAQPVPVAQAAGPDYRLEGGGQVVVDPATKRATVTRDGVTTPLYDGTHRAEDGTVLIIRNGIATIPNEAPPPPARKAEPPEQWEGAPIIGFSPCEKLVHRSCGLQEQCADAEGCSLARQLLGMEKEERKASDRHNRMTYTSGQCQESMKDVVLFPACSPSSVQGSEQ